MHPIVVVVLVLVAAAVTGAICFYLGGENRKRTAEAKLGSAEEEAKRIVNDAIKSAEQKRKETIIEAKDEAFRLKSEADKEINRKEFEYSVRKEVSKLSEKNQRFERMLEEGDAPRDMALAEGCSADAAAKRVWVIRQTLREPLSEIADEFGISRRKVAC